MNKQVAAEDSKSSKDEVLGKRAELVDAVSNMSVEGSLEDAGNTKKILVISTELAAIQHAENSALESPKKEVMQKKLKLVLKERLENAPSIIIDCDFATMQGDRQLASMVVQISECINLNKRCLTPVNLFLTGLHNKLTEKLIKQ